MKTQTANNRGFSLIELLVGTVLFTIITGAVFSLLLSAQLRYQGESSVTQAFQQANVALDQITRDVHSAGYPPRNSLETSVASNHPDRYALPFAWTPNYPTTPCTIGSCSVPGPTDLIIEADLGNGVQWIRYSMSGTTLMRGVVPKKPFADPVTETNGLLVPYLENVVNDLITSPIFSYTVDPGVLTKNPADIREVNICLVVQAPRPDPQTGQYRTITLSGQAIRFNPNQ
jgi:prepilin-type N-terminal cleavage/methylation domain-containing protein